MVLPVLNYIVAYTKRKIVTKLIARERNTFESSGVIASHNKRKRKKLKYLAQETDFCQFDART